MDACAVHEHKGSSAVILTGFTVLFIAMAASDGVTADNSERDQSIEIITDYASRHRLAADSAPDDFLAVRPEPLMFWTNPTRTSHFGGMHVWTRNDRPLAFCGIYVHVEDDGVKVSREFHSLTEEAMQARFDEEPIWAPGSPGVEFRPVPGAGQPAETPATRLRQMKAIASQFTITISLRDTAPERLRFMPRPIYRYSDVERGLADGTMIAFVQGTDPEAILLIEARWDDDDYHWSYAIARCTSWGLTARVEGDTVFEVAPYYGSGEHPMSAPFFCLHNTPLE